MAENTLGLNQVFPIYNQDGTPFNDMVLHKASVNSVVMSLGDKITGEAYYRNNSLNLTMLEYIVYNGVKYTLVNPPTIIREGLVNDNSELKGMTKYSFEFYHPMYQLGNIPFCDVAVSSDQTRYLSENKTFSWVGKPQDFIDKLNKNLQGTQWIVEKSTAFPAEKEDELSDVLTFDKNMISDALKTFHDTWDVPYIVDVVSSSESSYASGKRFKVVIGLPVTEIYASESDKQLGTPFVFRMGQGIGLKNNSRNPRNNKIITRLAGYGSEKNIPYGYPQIVWDGDEDDQRLRYPLYDGIVGGRYVKLIQHPFTRNHLMPSVYTDAVNKKVNPNATGYNPNIELKDYYDAVGGDYPNQINPLAPSYEIHEFEYIKPEMNDGTSNVEILGAIPLNADLTPASEWVDDIDGDGNFVQSFFQITLPQLAFDLYACAAITQEMQINMRSGDCIGCTFPIQVDWDDYKLNFYDENGDFAPDGSQRDLSKYPKSNLGSINVIVQKENSTFGSIMPSRYQQPQSGDEFVILGISLPVEYITRAEQRLDEAMQSFLLENNVYYYDYPLKFDEHFLTTHTYILSQIKPNAILRFQYAGQVLGLYVKQLTIKYGTAVLPEYDITLTDNIDVVLNQIGQVAEDIEKLSSIISILRQSYNRNVWVELAKKLSKVSDDTAQGFIRFIQGLQVGNQFVTGLLGEGGVFRKEADGTTYLEADKMYIRIKAYFDNVEIRDYKHSAGNRIASPAGAKCCRVEYIDSNGNVTTNVANAVKFRCYFRGSDGEDEVRNNFVVGDQAYCHVTSVDTKDDDPNSKSLNMKHYWRLVVGRNATNVLTENGEHWIDLSNRASETLTIDGETYTHAGYQSGSDVPSAQDDIIQLGNIKDTDRMGAIIEFVTGADAPSYQIFQGINNFNLNGKNYIGLGYSTQTGRAYMNVYGDTYIGDPNGSTFIKYNQGNKKLEIKAEVSLQSTFGGNSLDEYIRENTWTEQQIEALFADEFNDIDTAIENIQKQVDGSIETWFYDGVPTLSNLPASNWTTTDERINHLGDLYYDNITGYAYRFKNTGTDEHPQFEWGKISDQDVTKALADAAKAQDTADHKRRVFVRQPLASEAYDVGDLWVNATYNGDGVSYTNDVLRCNTAKAENVAFSIAHWEKASKYTDDTRVIDFITNTYAPFVTNIQGQVDGKAETWRQATDPASAWTTNADKIKHVGDLWMDISANGGKNTYIYVDKGSGANPRYDWEAQDVPQAVFDDIDGKSTIFANAVNTPPSDYKKGDMWILPSNATINGVAYKIGDVLNASQDSTTYNAAHWSKKVRYTDDTALNDFVNNTYNSFVSDIQSQVDGKAETWYQATDPSTNWTSTDLKNQHKGDIWHNTSSTTIAGVESGRDAIWNGTAWKMSDVPQSVYDTIDGKADIFVSKPSTYNVNDLWIIESTISDTDIPTGCKKGDIVISSTKRTNSYNKTDWKKKDRYTDDSAFNGYINAVLNGSGSSGDAATVAAAQKAIKDALVGETVVNGGLILSSLIAMRKYKGTGDKSDVANYNTWAGISGVRKDTETGTGWKGYGIAAWYGGAMTDHEVSTTATDYAKSLFRFDGSGYLASGNITWDKDGIVTIANVYSDVNGQHVPWSGATLQYITNLSTLLPITIQSGTTYLDPKVGFKQLSILGKSVATQEWVGQNYVSVAFFERLFQAYNGTTKVNTNSTSTIDNIKAMFGFWTEKYISALGKNDSGSSGGIDMTTVWSALAGSTDEQINASHLTTALSGYATTSWVNQNYALKSDIPTLATLSWSGYSSGSYNGSEAKTISIPNNTNQLTNGAGFITSAALSSYVTQVKVGTTAYNPSSGVVSLPAYPTKASWNYDDTYLKLSGGTVKGILTIAPTNISSYQDALVLHDNGGGSSEGARIRFTSSSYATGITLGANSDKTGLLINDTYTIYHSGNLTKVSQLTNDSGYVTSSGVTSITLKAGTGISLDVDNTAITSTGTRTITNSGVRATTINGNYLRVNTNGTNADLTIPYATNADTVDGYHASRFFIRDTHMYGLENLCTGVVKGARTSVVDGKIVTNGTVGDTYFYIKTSEAITAGQIYTFGFYVEGWPDGETRTWYFRMSNRRTCATVAIKGNGWNWGTGTGIPDEISSTSQVLIDDDGSLGLVLTFSKFILVKGDVFPYYTPPISQMSVASAAKLTTARTIWGQSFDGSGNVSGAITGATTISASSNVSVGGTLGVTGNTTLSGTLSVSKAATLSSTLGVTGATTLTGLLTANGGITIPSGKTLKIGDAVLSWDSTNQGIKITKGLYSETFISALGAGSGGSGGGGVGDVTWDLLANNSDTRQIALSHLTTALSGYATQSWVTNKGYITGITSSMVTTALGYTPANSTALGNYLPLGGGTMTGKLTFSQGNSTRDVGIIGTYDPNRAAAIWAMGASYQIKADGTTMGSLYGACYAYYGSGYTYGAGKSGGHSFVWCQKGSPHVALGDNVWTSGGFIKNGSSDSYVLLGGGGHLQISYSATNSTIAQRTANGYLFATYLNQSSGAETPTTSSYLMFANSDGYLRKSSLSNVRKILYPKMTSAHFGANGTTTKIKINITSNTTWMLCFTVTLYQGYRATKVMISGYQYGSNHWHQPEARILGDSDGIETISVYFGYDSTNNLWVGFDGGYYTGVAISDVVNGYTQIKNFDGLFTISNVSSLATLQATVTASSRANYAISAGTSGSCSGNAASATQLQTSRTIWGQSFNGTANVSGNMTGVGTISASGNIQVVKSSTDDARLLAQNNNGSIALLTSSNMGVYDVTNSNWLITTNGTNTCLPHGTVAIDSSAQTTYKLYVAGSMGGNSLSIANGGRINIQNEPSGSTLYIGNSGNQGWVRMQDICSAAGSKAGDASGWSIRTSGNALFANVQSNGYVTALSDARHKTVIKDTDIQVDDIAKMPAVVYRWNDGRKDNGLHVGSIAQDWQRILPEVVMRDGNKEGTLSMQYGVASLVSVITVAKRVVNHEKRIKELEEKCERLRTELSRYKAS